MLLLAITIGLMPALAAAFLVSLYWMRKNKQLRQALHETARSFSELFVESQNQKKSLAQQEESTAKVHASTQHLRQASSEAQGLAREEKLAVDKILQSSETIQADNATNMKTIELVFQNVEEVTTEIASINEVGKRMQHLKKQLDSIDTITFFSKILSVNAAIEAARANIKGTSGFAVVAQEINKLAEATEQVANSMRETFTATEQIMLATENNLIKRSEALGDAINRLKVNLSETDDIMDHLRDTSQGLSTANETFQRVFTPMIREVSEIIEQVDATQESTIAMKKSSSNIQSTVEQLSRDLSTMTGILEGLKITEIDVETAHKKISQYAKIIDVRQTAEYNDSLGHIEGSHLITIDDSFVKNIEMLKDDRSKPFLFVCRSGGRSSRAASLAQVAGFKNVSNLTGGMLAWNEAKLPIKRDAPMSTLHGSFKKAS